MLYVGLLTLLAVASSTARVAYSEPARETGDAAVRSGLIPSSGSIAGDSASFSVPSTDDGSFSNFLLQQQQRQQQQEQRQRQQQQQQEKRQQQLEQRQQQPLQQQPLQQQPLQQQPLQQQPLQQQPLQQQPLQQQPLQQQPLQQQPLQQQPLQQQPFFQTVNGNNLPSSGSVGQDGQAFSVASSGVASVSSRPQYEEHIQVVSGVRPVTTTTTNTVTQTHTLRVPTTSDVWVTSVTMMKVPVTQLFTQRSYVPVAANTVTSVIRITKTPIEVVTRTEEIYPTKTLVSVFTRFVTITETVELWQNIVHRATNYEVLTVPVVETQTLLQRLFSTTTVTRVVNVTSVQSFNVPIVVRSGEVTRTATPGNYY